MVYRTESGQSSRVGQIKMHNLVRLLSLPPLIFSQNVETSWRQQYQMISRSTSEVINWDLKTAILNLSHEFDEKVSSLPLATTRSGSAACERERKRLEKRRCFYIILQLLPLVAHAALSVLLWFWRRMRTVCTVLQH